ncbi:MAG: hypothetical protein FWG14_06815 [Peptococcaceae bacterium]|nr:hypothetical protein [Peptococcaceae bacterium]
MFGKKMQKIMVIALVLLLSVALVATSVGGIGYLFSKKPDQGGQDYQAAFQQEYDQLILNIEQLEARVAEDPSNADAQKALAGLYAQRAQYAVYWSFIGIITDPQADYQKAMEGFQACLEIQQERPADVLLALAEVSWRAGNNDLSESTYLELLEREPENRDVLIGYGYFLRDGLEDRDQAIAQWEKARSLTEDAEVQAQLDELIQSAKSQDIHVEEGNDRGND